MKTSQDRESPEATSASRACSGCGEEKSFDEFYAHPQGKDGRQSRCKSCQNSRRWEKGRFRTEEDKQRIYERNRVSYQRNKDKYARRQTERRLRLKIEAVALLGGECVECGCDHPLLLEFDHRDPADKLFEITKALGLPGKYPKETVKAEIQKCDLRCRNCHALRHVGFEVAQVEGEWIIGERKPEGGQKGTTRT